ncbi:FAD-dependent hydroxylase [Spirulina major]|uniref:FAD-dependent hydroxylase n=1 Tax=Spirulina major TaxID=270636 RepID=UPI00093438C6|nr:FAD-dependent hydroxylase [Spirulina major]
MLTLDPAPHPAHDPLALDCDLAIIGGGIVGATLAAALRGSGLRICLFEANSLNGLKQRQRAYAVSLLSSQIFTGIGIWNKIAPQIAPFRRIQLSDADYGRTVGFGPEDVGLPALGYVAEHQILTAELQAFLATSPQVQWRWEAQVTQVEPGTDYTVVHYHQGEEAKQVKTRLVVGADGARSPIRQQAQIHTKGWKYWQSCVTFTIRHQNPSNDTAYERFWYDGPMGVLPLPGNRCQVVWTAPHAEAQALQALAPDEFLARFAERTQHSFTGLEVISDRFLFPVQLMQSDRYSQPRLALIGDAAHCCHPVGGQGLNLGIRDAAALAEVLTTAHRNGEDLGSPAVLKRYERWRKPENWVILAFTDFLDRFFSNRIAPIVALRRLGLWGLHLIYPAKILALRLMTGFLGRRPQLAKLGE